ncbi:MAG TPA: CoA-transferase [Acidimicrobiia bacterium]|jgi:acyl CoA:acetate/3-ketoacid CoA transferase beta subunit|nr:CoA-transferase [Acidimicrobiia bacterium]
MRDGPPTRAEVCAAAIADCFANDGEILANPIGTLPVIGGRLAKATVAPELVMTDGEAVLVENILPVGAATPEKVVAGWNPYRSMFDVVWSGRRHVMMGASQIDPWGNQNFAFIGSHDAPRTQLLGMRGAPGNTINDKTSYWIPAHSTRVFVPTVDVVSGVGYDRAHELGAEASRFHHVVRVVTNLCVCDFETPDHRMRLRSVHPGVNVADVAAATGFELPVDGDVPESRLPTDDELRWIREVIDPDGLGEEEVPNP